MSANTVPLDRDALYEATAEERWETASLPASVEAEPTLRLLPQVAPRKRRLTPLSGALAAVAVILVTLFGQLGLSIAVSQGAYEARALQLELRDLTRVEQVLTLNTEKLASPQNLAENAVQLGMVQNSTPATLRLSDHTVMGALTGATNAVAGNVVPNAALEGLPIVDADGLLTDRNPEQAVAAAAQVVNTPVTWEGALPAPKTH